jgi:pyruvate carboxylase subunit B
MMGENPNKAVREWTEPFNKSGIRTMMLERGLSALRMNPVPSDVRELMFTVKKAQGTDISRSFCGLNDHRNLLPSIEYAHKAGMISQVALSISPVQTIEYYLDIADKVIEYGCDELCIKDMSGVGKPAFIAELISRIKKQYPAVHVQYHTHGGPNFSVSSILEAARAGADYIDVAAEPLAWGKGHPEVSAVRDMLVEDGFLIKDIDNQAYNEVKSLNQKYMKDLAERGVQPVDSLLTTSSLPGGMIGSLMSDLDGFLEAVNFALRSQGKVEITMNQLIRELLDEVEHIWPLLGTPPLVTPFSQYVKNTAMMNILNMHKGQPRWSTIDKDTWNMILGRMGQLPGALDPEIVQLVDQRGFEFYTGNPQELYPDELEKYRILMQENGWDCGQDDEELLEFAMHERQYRALKRADLKITDFR